MWVIVNFSDIKTSDSRCKIIPFNRKPHDIIYKFLHKIFDERMM